MCEMRKQHLKIVTAKILQSGRRVASTTCRNGFVARYPTTHNSYISCACLASPLKIILLYNHVILSPLHEVCGNECDYDNDKDATGSGKGNLLIASAD